MKKQNTPALLLFTLIALFALNAIFRAPALDPVRYTEADATATAIAPALEPTIQYHERVLPTQQAVEAVQIVETTQNRYYWQRVTDKTTAIAKIAQTASIALGVVLASVGVGVGIGGWFGARGIREVRQAALPMTRHLLEGPHITEHGTITHTATGAAWRVDEPQDALGDHARIVGATYDALPQGALVELLAAVAGGTANRAQIAQARYISKDTNLLT